ncbi:MAG: hypothetical protein AMXMBFR13_41060 [Phycisphaerae bacterium]
MMHATWAVLWLGMGLAAAAGSPAEATTGRAEGREGAVAFDAAPFGMVLGADEGKEYAEGRAWGVKWGEPRKIRRVVVEFGEGPLPKPEAVRLQYWHRIWDGRAEPILAEKGAGGVGWAAMDDWTNGTWKDADARVSVRGRQVVFTFAPSGEKEFPKIGEAGVGYRRTLKVRLVLDAADKPSTGTMPVPHVRLAAFTDAELRPLTVRMLLGNPAGAFGQEAGDSRPDAAGEPPRLEVYNGSLIGTRPIEGGIEADLLMAVDALDGRHDRTVVTVRAKRRAFSFAADEVARGERILVDDLGALVTRGGDEITLEGYRKALKEFPGRRIYDRVSDEPEQTLQRAWNDMPLKRPLYFVHCLPGNRNAMHQLPNGDIRITARSQWFAVQPSEKDTHRKLWDGNTITYVFGLPSDELRGGRELREGYLPLLRTWWQDGPVYYEQSTVLDRLEGEVADVGLDDPTVLLMKLRMVNTSAAQHGEARLFLQTQKAGGEKLYLEDDRVMAEWQNQPRVRYLVRTGNRGTASNEEHGVRWVIGLEPGDAHELFFAIPSVTPSEPQVDHLRRLDFQERVNRACAFWKEKTEQGTQIDTPEPWLNGFYRAHLRHLLANCYKETGSDRLHAHVGTFYYGVYPDESAMMISDLDRRGYHEEARRCLASFLKYQGTVQMPGNFKSTEGLFYGSGGHDTGGYNKSHGWVLWLMAEHWKYTRDRAWMEQAAPKLVKACDWVTRERQATMKTAADGSRPIEYGFLPSGSLEDVTDYWYWMVTNVCTVWGFDALATALADYGHAEAARVHADAKAFHDDVMRAVEESRVRAPVVKLRDGTYVPKYPSELYARGRTHGWLRETLEGSIHLLITEMIAPGAPEARWILDDFEDNLYISKDYGYDIPAFDSFWFSRGGFSMQANLLGGPLPYLYRDDVKHFLRAYFNSFASAFYPEIRMCNEHSLPELGYPAGDHYKSSDEAQSTYWLRLMFVNERGQDLYLGQAVPRYWLADGKHVTIERAASHFGPLSLRIHSAAGKGEIKATVSPPERNRPRSMYVRLRHPEGKPMKRVTVNGRNWDKFDAQKEWVILPGSVEGVQEIVAEY